MTKILLRRGPSANLPTLALGEPAFTTDTTTLYIGTSTGNVIIGGTGTFVQKSGDTMTGTLTVSGANIDVSGDITAERIDITGTSDERLLTIKEGVAPPLGNSALVVRDSSNNEIFAAGSNVFNVNAGNQDVDFIVDADSGNVNLHVDAVSERAGFGTGSPAAFLEVAKSRSSSTVIPGIESDYTWTATGTPSSQLASGIFADIDYAGSVNSDSTNWMSALRGRVTVTGSGSINGRVLNLIFSNTSSGTVANAYNIYLDAPTNTGGGAITTFDSLYIVTPTAGGTNFALRTQGGAVVINEDGGAFNFRVESDTNANMLYVDGTNNRIGIGVVPVNHFQVDGGNVVFNEDALSSFVFRVESASEANLFYFNASNNRIGIGTSSPSARLNVEGGAIVFNDNGANVNFRVEGSSEVNLLNVNPGNNNRIGIGTASPSTFLHLTRDYSGTTPINGFLADIIWTPGATPGSVFPVAVSAQLDYNHSAAPSGGYMIGMFGRVRVSGAGAPNCYVGDFLVQNQGSGTLATAVGLNLRAPQNTGGGAITDWVGIQILNSTTATNNYSIRTYGGNAVFNEAGLTTSDFRAEGTGKAHCLFVSSSSASIGLVSNTAPNFQSGVGIIYVANVGTTPSGNPSGGGFMYSEAGAGKWRGSSGTITTFGPAEPHCPSCGRDFMLEWENEEYGHLQVCMWCMTEELGKKEWVIKNEARAT